MSWFAELWHVLRRDVWRARWWLLVYVVTLALAVANASPSAGAVSVGLAPMGQVVLLMMPLVVAMTVHSDSALRVDAFWAVLPMRSSVVTASKVLCIVLLVGLWSAAVVAVMLTWRVSPVSAVMGLGLYDVVGTLALFLLGTALVTAACHSLAGVGVVLGAALAVSAMVVFTRSGVGLEFSAAAWWAIAAPTSAGAVVLLAHRYRVRTPSGLNRGMTMAAGVAVVVFPTLTLDARLPTRRDSSPRERAGAVTLQVPLQRQPRCEEGFFKLPLVVTSPPTWRVELMRPRLEVSLRDGSRVELSRDSWMQAAGLMGPMVPEDGARAVGDSADIRTFATEIWFDLPRDVDARVCGHVASVALRVQTHVAVPREVLRLPVAAVAPITVTGHRVRIASVLATDSLVALTVLHSALSSAGETRGDAIGEVDYVLADPALEHVIRLSDAGTHATVRLTSDAGSEATDASAEPWSDGGIQQDRSVLPGLTIMSRGLRLTADRDDTARARAFPGWRDRAMLLVIAPDWFPWEIRTVRSTVASIAASTPSTAVAPR